MGDRTYVSLIVLNTQKEKAKEYFDCTAEEEWENGDLHYFGFYEVNYGNLGFLDQLENRGIAYKSHWDNGNEYFSGTKYSVFTSEGDLVHGEVYDSAMNPDIHELMALIDQPQALREYIQNHAKNVMIPPLETIQEEYGKIYQAKRLII